MSPLIGVAIAAIAGAACKADPPPSATASGSQAPRVEAPAGSGAPSVPASQLMPNIDGAKLFQSRTQGLHAFATWCIDEPDATERVMAALRRDGWTGIRTRGEGAHVGVAATKGDARFAANTAAHDERCAGTFISATVMRLGKVELPPIEDRIR